MREDRATAISCALTLSISLVLTVVRMQSGEMMTFVPSAKTKVFWSSITVMTVPTIALPSGSVRMAALVNASMIMLVPSGSSIVIVGICLLALSDGARNAEPYSCR